MFSHKTWRWLKWKKMLRRLLNVCYIFLIMASFHVSKQQPASATVTRVTSLNLFHSQSYSPTPLFSVWYGFLQLLVTNVSPTMAGFMVTPQLRPDLLVLSLTVIISPQLINFINLWNWYGNVYANIFIQVTCAWCFKWDLITVYLNIFYNDIKRST